jgi:hypothetical protein
MFLCGPAGAAAACRSVIPPYLLPHPAEQGLPKLVQWCAQQQVALVAADELLHETLQVRSVQV